MTGCKAGKLRRLITEWRQKLTQCLIYSMMKLFERWQSRRYVVVFLLAPIVAAFARHPENEAECHSSIVVRTRFVLVLGCIAIDAVIKVTF